jgi:hypothetical protein
MTWHWHHPVTDEMVTYAGTRSEVLKVGYYHGGDALYVLEGVLGTWHESCLEPAN